MDAKSRQGPAFHVGDRCCKSAKLLWAKISQSTKTAAQTVRKNVMGRLRENWLGVVSATLFCAMILGGCKGPDPGSVKDEAMQAGRTAENPPGSDDDYLRDMDRGLDAEAVHMALPFLPK